jgi:hypothetical protein
MGVLDGLKDARPEYMMEPYIGKCKVVGIKTSDEIEGYKSTPFISFKLDTAAKIPGEGTFWLSKPGEDQQKVNRKRLKLRGFLETIGVDVEATPQDKLLDAAVGKEFEGAFSRREYIGKDSKNNNKPTVRTRVELRYWNKAGVPFTGNINVSTLVEPLDDYMQNKLKDQLELWNDKYGQSNDSTPAAATQEGTSAPVQGNIDNIDDVDDDLPF